MSESWFQLRKKATGYWAERIGAEIDYLLELSADMRAPVGRPREELERAIDFLIREYGAQRTISAAAVAQAEGMLADWAAPAKQYTVICAAHAHIDMNWMWRWDETVAVTLDTFGTILDLMREFPDFHFSQSQAAVYRIVARYDPEMLAAIKERIAEGRWEVTAATWVEADKNLPSGESMVRQILHTKKYLQEILGIAPETLQLDFEPDTFGHSANVPEILADGGVAYYYHCRGSRDHNLFRWMAPSGRSVLAYREPLWYNMAIDPSLAAFVPAFCRENNLQCMLKVYGVGDHGGGPTRRDLEKINDMKRWPLFPAIRCGTYREFFAAAARVAETLPEVRGELNYVFSGCYSSQSRIKKGNRAAENALAEAEFFSALAAEPGVSGFGPSLSEAWRDVLFNQFHDIITGSGTVDTREYAMGLYQKVMARAGTVKTASLRQIVPEISGFRRRARADDGAASWTDDTAQGAGAGYGLSDFRISQCSRGGGRRRVFIVFNPSPAEREEVVEITVWDWEGDPERMVFRDEAGRAVALQLLDRQPQLYWQHQYYRVFVMARVPAGGYRAYLLTEADGLTADQRFPADPRIEEPLETVLENERLKAVLDPRSCAVLSLLDKETGRELLDGRGPGGLFRLLEEDDGGGMTAWMVGRYLSVQNLAENVRIVAHQLSKTALRQYITYRLSFLHSALQVTVSLDQDASRLDYAVACDWREIGGPGNLPQLGFHLPLGYECPAYQYDIPCGATIRPPLAQDVPANSWALALAANPDQKRVMLISDAKHGFRGDANSMALTLIRSSYDPDPYPEIGKHSCRFAVCVVDGAVSNQALFSMAYDYNHALTVQTTALYPGNLPAAHSLIRLVAGSVALSALKFREDGRGVILRVYETDGAFTRAVFDFARPIRQAGFADLNENKMPGDTALTVAGARLIFEVRPYRLCTVEIQFAGAC